MDDCEEYGRKHRFKIEGATNGFLVGDIWFKCRRCSTKVKVDRFWFYFTMVVRSGGSWL